MASTSDIKLPDKANHEDSNKDTHKHTKFKSEKNFWGKYSNVSGEERPNIIQVAKWILCETNQTGLPSSTEELDQHLPILEPDIALLNELVHDDIRITWIGHSTLLVQMEGLNILTDPVFSTRCSPVQLPPFGYKRFRRVPMTIQQLPVIHAVVISHDHYDHLDYNSVRQINSRFGLDTRWFVPAGLGSWISSRGCQNYVEMEWWDEDCITTRADVKFIFTPAQHWGRRGLFDENKVLWGSWSILGSNHRFFFGGDSGYCDVFKEIGQRFGPFQLAAIAIGAYCPRWVMEVQHIDPAQAVLIHQDIKAEKSVGVHWGTFALAYEPYMEPKTLLEEELRKANIPLEQFFTLKHGETRHISGNNPLRANADADIHATEDVTLTAPHKRTWHEQQNLMREALEKRRFSDVAKVLEPIRDVEMKAKLLQVETTTDDRKMVLENILDMSYEEYKKNSCVDSGKYSVDKSEYYTLFDFDRSDSMSFEDVQDKHLLSIIAQSQSVTLLHHNYIQQYIRVYWDQYHLRHHVWAAIICYMVMIFCASLSTISAYHLTIEENNTENQIKPVTDQSDNTVTLVLTELFCIMSALVLLGIEGLQLCVSGVIYFRSVTNIFDCLNPILAVIVCTYNVISPSISYGRIAFHAVSLVLVWMGGAWKIAIVPHIPPKRFPEKADSDFRYFIQEWRYSLYTILLDFIKQTSISFMMFFEILKTVLLTFPVILYFCLVSSVAFTLIIGPAHAPEQGFKSVSHSFMTLLVMSIGELGYNDLYQGEETPFTSQTMFAFGYLLLLLFLICLPITGMNLLIGKAIYDVNKIKAKCEVLVFQHLVGHIFQYESMRRSTCQLESRDKKSEMADYEMKNNAHTYPTNSQVENTDYESVAQDSLTFKDDELNQINMVSVESKHADNDNMNKSQISMSNQGVSYESLDVNANTTFAQENVDYDSCPLQEPNQIEPRSHENSDTGPSRRTTVHTNETSCFYCGHVIPADDSQDRRHTWSSFIPEEDHIQHVTLDADTISV